MNNYAQNWIRLGSLDRKPSTCRRLIQELDQIPVQLDLAV